VGTASTTHPHDYLNFYVNDLSTVVDIQAISESSVYIGVDPLGGASVAYRPGTESIYKIYAESFKNRAHLDAILREAQEIVDNALKVRS
jgi:phosphoglucomutase